MAITPPTVGALFLQADVNAAIAAVCALIDQDRARLDGHDSSVGSLQSTQSSLQSVQAASQSNAAELRGLINSLRHRLRV